MFNHKISFQSLESRKNSLPLLEKIKALASSSTNSISFFNIAAPFIFLFFFFVSFNYSIPETIKPIVLDHQYSSHNNNIAIVDNINNTQKSIQLFSPDLIISSILNYHSVVTILPSHVSATHYLKNPDTAIDFSEIDNMSNALLNKRLDTMQIIDNLNGIVYAKRLMLNEDMSIISFKSGDVIIDSTILETTQSPHYYMVVVLKTFTQHKKVIQVVEKKIFHLDALQNGKIQLFANVILHSHITQ